MIRSFADKGTQDIYHGNNSRQARKQLPGFLHHIAARKMDLIDAAQELKDILEPPGNHLEALSGNLNGLHSIRINNQWRIIFK